MPDVLRPFAWLAALAFLAGFVSYLALAQPQPTAVAHEDARAIPASVPASGPVSDEWNVEKHI